MEWDSDARLIVNATHMLISIYTDAPKRVLFKCVCACLLPYENSSAIQ
ncbi:unnamed protein product [Brassica oleracea]|uniref:(rape) hypothetical protein n=1 Tax=Brassica napus TaxID=3708 RepID=A0A816JHD2_BRANA|nr:unnamed protein product [Brassica napus]